jgi:hypothetical protein
MPVAANKIRVIKREERLRRQEREEPQGEGPAEQSPVRERAGERGAVDVVKGWVDELRRRRERVTGSLTRLLGR